MGGGNFQRWVAYCSFRLSPKLWEVGRRDNGKKYSASSNAYYRDKTDGQSKSTAKIGKLDRLWQISYKESQKYFAQQIQKQQQQQAHVATKADVRKPAPTRVSRKRSALSPPNNITFQKQYT